MKEENCRRPNSREQEKYRRPNSTGDMILQKDCFNFSAFNRRKIVSVKKRNLNQMQGLLGILILEYRIATCAGQLGSWTVLATGRTGPSSAIYRKPSSCNITKTSAGHPWCIAHALLAGYVPVPAVYDAVWSLLTPGIFKDFWVLVDSRRVDGHAVAGAQLKSVSAVTARTMNTPLTFTGSKTSSGFSLPKMDLKIARNIVLEPKDRRPSRHQPSVIGRLHVASAKDSRNRLVDEFDCIFCKILSISPQKTAWDKCGLALSPKKHEGDIENKCDNIRSSFRFKRIDTINNEMTSSCL
ncbi:hypothetical protein MAR_010793, partial [Mya arenaria]